jgi:uncharacterized protein (DUF362 family)
MSTLAERIQERLSRKRSHRVILRRCDDMNAEATSKIIDESLTDLGFSPRGKVLIKPNIVTANRGYIHHSYTDPALVAQAIGWMKSHGASDVTVGESSGFGVPSRLFFSEAGYLKLQNAGARVVDFNVEPYVNHPLERGMHHKSMRTAKSLAEADTLVWMPKLKWHICCTITCALKLNVGILMHAERMIAHDDRLDEKIVDLLEIGYPDVVITDAVMVGHGYESAPKPHHLGVLMISDDPVATDIVAARVLGYEPEQCKHLMLAMERGYGPSSIDDVTVEGDITVDELRERSAGVVSEYQDIQKVETPIKFYSGNDPDRGRFCHGGCLAAVKGCLGTIDKRRPGSVANAKPGAIVTGVYDGDVDAGDGIALLIGSCTKVNGEIRARKVRRIGGCPIGTMQLMLGVPLTFGLPSPMFDVKDGFKFVAFSIDKLFRKAFAMMSRSQLQ